MKTNYRNILLFSPVLLSTIIIFTLIPAAKALAMPGYDAQGCNDLSFTVEVIPRNPQTDGSVEVSGLAINDPVADLYVSSISGTCNTGLDHSPPDTSRPGKGFIVYDVRECLPGGVAKDSTGIVGMLCVNKSSGLLEFAEWGNNIPAPLKAPHAFTLQTKNFIGKQEIDLTSITKGFTNLYTTWGNYDWRQKPLMALVNSTNANKLVLRYTPACSATVNNVVFPGTPSSSSISNGTISPQQAEVKIQCNDILPKYSVTIDSPHGIHNKDGIIKSTNDSVGYRLTWGNNLSNSGLVAKGNVQLSKPLELEAGARPHGNNFSIPVDITPVSLTSAGKDIIPGPANSELLITLKFN